MRNFIPILIYVLININLSSAFTLPTTPPSKIIFLLPVASKSHKNVFEPLVHALLERGHIVTVVSPVKSSQGHPNLTEIHPVTLEEILKSPAMSGGNMFKKRNQGKLATLLSLDTSFVNEVCHKFYQNTEIRRMIETKEKFDLAIVNAVPNQCVLGFVHVLKMPHIYLGTLPVTNAHIAGVGGVFPRSFVPSAFGPYLDSMTFTERVMNYIIEIVSGRVYYQSGSADIYRQYLGPEVPSVEEIDKNVSMIFMNTNLLLTFARPLMPQIVEVGGMHCRKTSKLDLPPDLAEILDKAKHGFIYFSLGSIVKTKNMPPEVRTKFLNVFSRLKQTIIWKWDNENETDLPENVVVRRWLPQQEILSHPNIKLFITHGGLLSTQEAVFFGVPMLGSPMYVDQDLNMIRAEDQGLGLRLEISDFTEESLEEKINRIVNDPSFSQRAKHLSKIFQDQPETPIERAVFYAEYVIRHKGAYHLQSPGRNLNFFQYFSFDVILFLCGITIILLIISLLALYKLMRLLGALFTKRNRIPKIKSN